MSNSLSILFSSLLILGLPAFSAERPNVLWFVIDDMSSHFSCYGETAIQTPHTDRLAAAGMRFTNTHVTAPVCSTSRSAMITGMYQTSLRAHHHRSGRGEIKIHLPEGVKLAPELFQEAGYFTCIGSGLPDKDLRGLAFPANTPPKRRFGKTDYNFEWDPAVYDSHDWADCPPDKPFFMQVQLHGGKMRLDSLEHNLALQERARAELGSHTDPASVTLPPYYPDHPTLRQDWAAYLDSVRLTDHHIGLVIERLQQENRLQNTFIIVMTDHGISHARGKQFLYTEGTQIPFILSGPGVASGLVRDDLVEHIDMLPTSLAVASISIPTAIQGKNLLASDYQARDFTFAARDRCDETTEYIRSIRSRDFLFIHNGHPQRPHLQPNAYKDKKHIVNAIRTMHQEGTLPSVCDDLLLSPTRQPEELYHLPTDPWQLTNLALNPDYAAELQRHRQWLKEKLAETDDPPPETAEQYDSDMAEYLKKPNPQVAKNIAQMKKWAAEGK